MNSSPSRPHRKLGQKSLSVLLGAFLLATGRTVASDEASTSESAAVPRVDEVVLFEDQKLGGMLMIPEGVRPLRGLIVHVGNMPLKPSSRWTEIARSLRFGHLVLKMPDGQSNRIPFLEKRILPVLDAVAEKLERPELREIPLGVAGHSKGGLGLPAFLPHRDRFLTAAVDCFWVYRQTNPDNALTVPVLFVIGSIPDNFQMLDSIPADYFPARAKGALAGLALEWGKAHRFGNAGTLFAAWFQSVAEGRLPDNGSGMRAMPTDQAWLGDPESWESNAARIFPTEEYPGDPQKAVWLPDRSFAHVWRAFQSKEPPVQLTIKSGSGESHLEPFRLGEDHQMEIGAGERMVFGLEVKDAAPQIRRVRFFRSDEVLGEANAAPWEFSMAAAEGAHPVYAEVETGSGATIFTNPALLLVKPKGVTEQTRDLGKLAGIAADQQ